MAEKMLVTEGLNELKLLDSRIEKTINNSSFVAGAKKVDKNVRPSLSKEDFNSKAKADYDSVLDLIARRAKIKAAIVASNAVTTVKVGETTMTVAEAIERKSSINYEVMLCQKLLRDYTSAQQSVVQHNYDVDESIEALVTTAYGKESKQSIKPEDYEAIAKPYKEANEWALEDPVSANDVAVKLEAEIDDFKSNVDSALQISNCTTYIEF